MSKPVADRDRPEPIPTTKKLEDLYGLIEKIETAMFTTRRPDGHLVSRPSIGLVVKYRGSGYPRLTGTNDLWDPD